MGECDKNEKVNGGDQRPPSIHRRAVLRGAVATGASGALAGCLGSFEREYEATPATIPEETAIKHNLDPTPEVKKRSGTITQGLGIATIEADVTGYVAIYKYQGDEQQTEEPTAESASTPTPEPTSTPTPTPTPEPTPTSTDPQTTPEEDDEDDDQVSPQTPTPTSVAFTDKKLQSTEDGFVVVVDRARLDQGGFITLRKGNLSGDVLGVSDYLEPGEHINVRVRLNESISGEVILHAVARKDDGNNTFDPATDQTYTKNGRPISDSAVMQPPSGTSVGSVEPDALNIISTPNPNFVGLSFNPAATKSIENLIEEETEAFEQACNCTIENPGQVEVKSVDPADAQVSREDIGKTVFHLDKESESLSDIPKSTELLGDEKPIELFLIPSSGEKENTLRTDLVAATKTTGQLKSGTNEAVVASYISNNLYFIPQLNMGGIALISINTSKTASGTPTPTEPTTPAVTPESDQGDAGLVPISQVKKTTNQLSGVCPSVTGSITPTPEPTSTAQKTFNKLVNRLDRLRTRRHNAWRKTIQAKQKAEGWGRVAQFLKYKAEVKRAGTRTSGEKLRAKRRLVESATKKGYAEGISMAEAKKKLNAAARIYDEAFAEYTRLNQVYKQTLTEVRKLRNKHGTEIDAPASGPLPSPTPSPPPESACYTTCECKNGFMQLKAQKGGDGGCFTLEFGHTWITIGRRYWCKRVCGSEVVKEFSSQQQHAFDFYPKSLGNMTKIQGIVAGVKGQIMHHPEGRGRNADCIYGIYNLDCGRVSQILQRFKRLANPKHHTPPEYSLLPLQGSGENCTSWAVEQWNKTLEKHKQAAKIDTRFFDKDKSPDETLDTFRDFPGGPICSGPGLRPNTLCNKINQKQ